MREENQSVEVRCPKCDYTEIVYIPKEEIPKCPKCKVRMLIREILEEGKSY
jgi:hypothetical protein